MIQWGGGMSRKLDTDWGKMCEGLWNGEFRILVTTNEMRRKMESIIAVYYPVKDYVYSKKGDARVIFKKVNFYDLGGESIVSVDESEGVWTKPIYTYRELQRLYDKKEMEKWAVDEASIMAFYN